jgi:hypothetical protein
VNRSDPICAVLTIELLQFYCSPQRCFSKDSDPL